MDAKVVDAFSRGRAERQEDVQDDNARFERDLRAASELLRILSRYQRQLEQVGYCVSANPIHAGPQDPAFHAGITITSLKDGRTSAFHFYYGRCVGLTTGGPDERRARDVADTPESAAELILYYVAQGELQWVGSRDDD